MLRNRFLSTATLLFALSLSACSKNSDGEKDRPVSKLPAAAALQWNEVAYNAFGGPTYQHSLMASRINAMVQLAIHDALNGIEQKYTRYAFNGTDKKADPLAAAASAAYQVLLSQIPDRKPFLDSAYNLALATVPDGDAETRGVNLGKAAADAVLAKRANDGAAADPVNPVPPSTVPGVYQAVPPLNFAFALHWQNVPTFSLQSKSQFRPVPHPALGTAAYAEAFNEVKATGKSNSSTRTPDQTAYSHFWYEFSEAGWNRMARTVIENKRLNLLDAARLLALVDMAMADGYIAGWDAKIHYNFWRPLTAIRAAATDGNDATVADATWEPLEVTPPIHDYPSTHSALGNAAATVMARLLGDATAFTFSSPTAQPSGASRSFTSFSQAARENADSRVRAGIHFRFSCEAGLTMGEKIGNWTVDNYLKPLK